jgi:hypothetical protein
MNVQDARPFVCNHTGNFTAFSRRVIFAGMFQTV